MLFNITLLICLYFFTTSIFTYLFKLKIDLLNKYKMPVKILGNLLVLFILKFIMDVGYHNIIFLITLEGGYHLFKKYKEVDVFDQITIITLFSTILTLLVTYLGSGEFHRIFITDTEILQGISALKEMQPSVDSSLITEVKSTLIQLNYYYYLIAFVNNFIVGLIFYTLINRRSKSLSFVKEWHLSYLWTILYIIPFVISKIFGIDNYLLRNIFKISLSIFGIYGMKNLFFFLFRRKKNPIMKVLLFIIFIHISLSYFQLMAIFGGITSFKKREEDTDKKD